MEPILRATDVHVTRGSRHILRDLSIEVSPGEIVAVVGPNGAGKSSLLAVLSGELAPASGRVLLDGQPIGRYRPGPLARRRSVLLQSNQVSFPFAVEDIVAMGRSPWAGTPREEHDEEVIAQSIEKVGIAHLVGRKFTELSGGERARVSLARVLAQDTPLVLLDEPTAALDIHHQERVMGIIRSLAREDKAVVVVIHDIALAAATADRVVLLVAGEVVADGPPREVLTSERLTDVYGVPIAVWWSDEHQQLLVVPERS